MELLYWTGAILLTRRYGTTCIYIRNSIMVTLYSAVGWTIWRSQQQKRQHAGAVEIVIIISRYHHGKLEISLNCWYNNVLYIMLYHGAKTCGISFDIQIYHGAFDRMFSYAIPYATLGQYWLFSIKWRPKYWRLTESVNQNCGYMIYAR